MTFKPGDIVVAQKKREVILLILEIVDEEDEVYKVVFLTHEYKGCVGKITCVPLRPEWRDTLLQDIDLK